MEFGFFLQVQNYSQVIQESGILQNCVLFIKGGGAGAQNSL